MPFKKKCWSEGFQQLWQKSCRILSSVIWLSQSLKASFHATFPVFLSFFSNWFHSFSALAWLWWYITDIDHNRSVLGDACIFTSQFSDKYSDDNELMMSKAGTVQGKWGSASLLLSFCCWHITHIWQIWRSGRSRLFLERCRFVPDN